MNAKLQDTLTPPGVGLVQKTLQILDLFQQDTPKWTQAKIAKTTGLPKSTINRLVKFLTDRGYLALTNGRNYYSLGPSAIDLGRRASAQFDFRGVCRPMLERISSQTGETVILTSVIGTGNAVRCVDQIESTHEGLRVFEQIGGVFPLHAGASPKAVLASLGSSELERYLSRPLTTLLDQTPVDKDALRRDIQESKARGYALSLGETYIGVAGVSAAFFWTGNRAAGSIAIALPEYRAGPDAMHRMGLLLKSAAEEITTNLSGDPSLDDLRVAS